MHGLFIDPETGRYFTDAPNDRIHDVESPLGKWRVRRYLRELHPLERRVLRWLLGIDCEALDAAEIAERMNMTVDQVWRSVDRAAAQIGFTLLTEEAA